MEDVFHDDLVRLARRDCPRGPAHKAVNCVVALRFVERELVAITANACAPNVDTLIDETFRASIALPAAHGWRGCRMKQACRCSRRVVQPQRACQGTSEREPERPTLTEAKNGNRPKQ